MGLRKTIMKTAAVATARRVSTRLAKRQGENIGRAADWAVDRVRPRRKNTFARTAAKGLGAAAIALPLGMWLGRRRRGTEEASY